MTTIDELIEKLTYVPSDFKVAAYQALMRGEASRQEQHAAASGIALSVYYQGEAASALSSLQEQKRKLEEALTKAAERFREYERSHAEKALEFEHSAAAPCPACQRLDKADRNRVMAEMCEALLSGGGE